MTGPIVVGVDGSETAERAAARAKQLAVALGARLHIVSAFDTDRTEVLGSGSDTWIVSDADTTVAIAKQTASALEAPGLTVTYSAARGKPAEAIVAEAERLDAQMIVVGNRGMQGLGRLLGSVANKVAHSAPCDVYIVKTVGSQP
ncbi:universal stress protein UspA [Sinomonas atrocyanea]|uniref:Universal stress protein UspA n=1 Tax=Sinomonas atrocyanea TaxID=37927 RepID=A0A126ZXI0_9MICC|nr:universal stress protein [Sinomonas atrocyanea]AMM31878.1 universal stress protein UspA [Sinomonas atrocyanea]GEB66012.1 universal stress protein A [Sinomonas atrocyanea]GGG74088.1 universal stress protein A [Sinomonas atrocyanea]